MKGVNCDMISGLVDLISSPNGSHAFYSQVVPHTVGTTRSEHDTDELTSRLLEHCLSYGLTRKTISLVIDRGFRSLQLLSLLPPESIPIKFPNICERQRSLLRICISALDRYSKPEYQVVRGLMQLKETTRSSQKEDNREQDVQVNKNEMFVAIEMMNSVRKLLECPVCYQVCTSPRIWQCTNGHLTCDQCHEHSTTCPLCRSAFSNVRPLAIEKLSRQVPLKCMNSGQGCEAVLPQREREEHQLSCLFTLGHCPVLSCSTQFRISDTLHHMETHHNLSVQTASLQLHPGATMSFRSSISMGSYLSGSSDQQNWWWGPQFVVYESVPFFFVISRRVVEQVDSHQGYFYFWLWIGGNQAETTRFLYTVTVESLSGERISYTAPPVSLRESVSAIRDRQACLLLTDAAVQRMTVKTDNGRGHKLQYRIEIIDKQLNEKV